MDFVQDDGQVLSAQDDIGGNLVQDVQIQGEVSQEVSQEHPIYWESALNIGVVGLVSLGLLVGVILALIFARYIRP